MKDICESCRAICSDNIGPDSKFCHLDFTCRHSYLFEDMQMPDEQLSEYLKQNMRDWKNLLRDNE